MRSRSSVLLKISIGFVLGIIFGFIVSPMLPNSPALTKYVMPFIDSLDEDTRRTLENLGSVLGRYDPATQLEALDTCRLHLRQSLETRQSGQAQETHLILGLSFSASLLLGILLI